MEQISDTDLFEMMDIVSSSPELRERVERRIQSNRKSKKAYNAKAYAEKKKKQKKRSFQGSVYFRCLEAKEKANESRRG